MSLKDHCHCEHARESHFEQKYNCTALHCECKQYQLYSDPYVNGEPSTERSFKAAPAQFDPFDGYDDGTPITWPMFPAAPKKSWP